MYKKYFKRLLDFILSLIALIILSPILLILVIVGTITMHGNPFFIQIRPGKKDKSGQEKCFKLIKLRTMSNKKDVDGNFLPDSVRLNKYGRFLRTASIDELPELINVLKGDMSLVGPRPLAMQYLPYYTEFESHRHDARPGISGLAQVKGRNALNWETKFEYDIEYINNITFLGDLKIIFMTIKTILGHENIGERGVDAPMDFDVYRTNQLLSKENKY